MVPLENEKNDSWKEMDKQTVSFHDNADIELKDVKIYYNTNQFPELSFYGPHYKPHDERGLIKHHHFRFYTKLGMGVCAMCSIPCACVACTSYNIQTI